MAVIDIAPVDGRPSLDGSRSSFNAQNSYAIDMFFEMFELSATDAVNVQRWKQLKAMENRTTAEELEFATLTSTLSKNILTSEDWNKLCDCMINLEKMYVDKGLDKIQTTVEDYVESYTEETKLNDTINERIGSTINNLLLTDATQIIISETQPPVVDGALWIKPKTT